MDTDVIPSRLPLGGFELTRTTAKQLNQTLQQRLTEKQQTALFFANTNFIVKCQALRPQMTADTLIINDGIGVDIATWLVHRTRFPENLNGTDYIPAFLHRVRADARVYLFGGKPGIAERAAKQLHENLQVQVVGTSDGYQQAQDQQRLLDSIKNSRANIVLVAMGNPMQEAWVLQNRQQLPEVQLLFGVGALLDFLAGDKARAPEWVRTIRMEWCYRLCLEPARLLRRYTIDIAVFLALCLRIGKQTHHIVTDTH